MGVLVLWGLERNWMARDRMPCFYKKRKERGEEIDSGERKRNSNQG